MLGSWCRVFFAVVSSFFFRHGKHWFVFLLPGTAPSMLYRAPQITKQPIENKIPQTRREGMVRRRSEMLPATAPRRSLLYEVRVTICFVAERSETPLDRLRPGPLQVSVEYYPILPRNSIYNFAPSGRFVVGESTTTHTMFSERLHGLTKVTAWYGALGRSMGRRCSI